MLFLYISCRLCKILENWPDFVDEKRGFQFTGNHHGSGLSKDHENPPPSPFSKGGLTFIPHPESFRDKGGEGGICFGIFRSNGLNIPCSNPAGNIQFKGRASFTLLPCAVRMPGEIFRQGFPFNQRLPLFEPPCIPPLNVPPPALPLP